MIAPTATVEGQQVAQVMIISCADGNRIPNFRQNFTFAAGLQQQAARLYPDLMRPILFDQNRFYNQDLTTGSLLLEFGSHGNTLAQAKRSARVGGKEPDCPVGRGRIVVNPGTFSGKTVDFFAPLCYDTGRIP